MTGRTGYTAITDGDDYDPAIDITGVYEHFDPLIGESVANAAALPSSGNWKGRTVLTEDTDLLWICTDTAGSGTWQTVSQPGGLIPLIPTGAAASGGGTATVGTDGRVTLASANGIISVDGLGGYKRIYMVFEGTGTVAGTLTGRLRTTVPAQDTTTNYTTGAGAAASSWTFGVSALKHTIRGDIFNLGATGGKEAHFTQYDHNPSANTAAYAANGFGYGGASPAAMGGMSITTTQALNGDWCFYGYNDN